MGPGSEIDGTVAHRLVAVASPAVTPPIHRGDRWAVPSSTMNAARPEPRTEPPPDLQTQIETLLHQVWAEEERWRREERIDLAIRLVRDV